MKFNKQKVMKVLPFVILGYAFNKVSQAFTSAAGTELGDKIMNGMDSLGEVFLNPLPSFNPIDILIGIAGGVIIKLAIYIKGKDAKKYRKGCEYGSARWGNAEDIKPYILDEFANIGQIPKFDKLIATIRSREISASIILQAQSQLKAIYKDNADTIVGNCDTTLFLGGKEKTTLKEISEILGKETIDLYNTGESRGKETSHSLNYQKTGKELAVNSPHRSA